MIKQLETLESGNQEERSRNPLSSMKSLRRSIATWKPLDFHRLSMITEELASEALLILKGTLISTIPEDSTRRKEIG